jgi:short-subunit dehydrogenase
MADSGASRPIALITGASSGIGAIYARRLAQRGFDLLLVARRRERLEQLAEDIRKQSRAQSEILATDLRDPVDVGELQDWIAANQVEILVNNAGFAGYQPFVQQDRHVADDLLSLHVRTITMLTRSALPGMVQRHRGAIVNVSSLLSLAATIPPNPMPYRAVYAGAKSYILTFTQALAGELKDSGVYVQALLPGVVATEFHNETGLDRTRLAAMAMMPDDVVAASLAALDRREVICAPGLDDPSLLENLGKAQRAVMEAANRPQLAARYDASAASR